MKDVTVVVIVFNDAKRLSRAVASVQRQTGVDLEIVIVDDASTDGSFAVAERLASADSRIRAVQLPANSGGCSRPRNVGIDHAEGRYVMFLDSDDVLAPHACRRLVRAADEAQADFSAGRCVRVHVSRGGEVRPWYYWLYNERTVYASVRDNPDLLYDTLSTNKCYRRGFLEEQGLRFPDGYHWEDLLFSAKAYVDAERIAIIPDVVYHWNVVEDTSTTPSISNRRSDLQNFRDRLAILRLIDEEFERHQAVELKLAKDVKFLRHDLPLYLTDFPFRPPEDRREFLALAKEYLTTLDPRAFDRARPLQAIAAWLILHDDETNLMTAIDYVCHGEKVSTRLVLADGRVFWCADHLDTAEGRAVLDVTDLGLHTRAFRRTDLYNRVHELAVDHGRVTLAGEILNQLDRVPRDAALSIDLVLAPRRAIRSQPSVKVTDWEHRGDVIAWRATVDLRRLVRAVGFVDRVWDFKMRLSVGDEVNIRRVFAPEQRFTGIALPVRPLLGRLAADRLETLVTPTGSLALEFVPGTAVARWLHSSGQRARHAAVTRKARAAARVLRKAVRNPAHPRLLQTVFRHTLLRLPAQRHVVFESERGARCTGNPRAIHDELRRRGYSGPLVWAHRDAPIDFPPDARLVRHGSLRYYLMLARAAVWIDDVGFPRAAAKRPETLYLQTWSGTPVRLVGFETRRMRRSAGSRAALRAQVDRWDALLVRSPYDEQILTRALRFRARVIRAGYPRNDVLVTGAAPDDVDSMRRRLTLAPEQRAILYVRSCEASVLEPDASMLGPGQVLVVRPAGAHRERPVPTGAIDASAVGDLATLLATVDAVVTEHDPVMFDLPLRRRPVVLIGCRCRLRTTRGDRDTYLDLDDAAPGPTVWDAAALSAELQDLDALRGRYADELERAAKEYGGYEQGEAAASAADIVMTHLGGGRP